MKYVIQATIEVDTSTNKIVLHSNLHRIVLMPVTSRGEDIYCVVNDRPAPGQIKRASDVLRWLAQNVVTKAQYLKLNQPKDETQN